jgi:hypothetical protein
MRAKFSGARGGAARSRGRRRRLFGTLPHARAELLEDPLLAYLRDNDNGSKVRAAQRSRRAPAQLRRCWLDGAAHPGDQGEARRGALGDLGRTGKPGAPRRRLHVSHSQRCRRTAGRGGGRESGGLVRGETCPVSTEGGTRRVQLVREGGGRGVGRRPRAAGGAAAAAAARHPRRARRSQRGGSPVRRGAVRSAPPAPRSRRARLGQSTGKRSLSYWQRPKPETRNPAGW